MYLLTTQCFAAKVGGIESLVTNLAKSIANENKIIVLADQQFPIQDKIFDFQYKDKMKILRYKGLKFFRRYRKANDIKILLENKKIDRIISDTWKSLELCIEDINNKKIPTLCLVHGNELFYESERKKNRVTKVLKLVDYIVANSNYTKSLVINLGINKKKIHVINPGAEDLRNIENTKKLNIIGDPIVLTLARLEKRKGHANVIKTIQKLIINFPKIKYLIAGDGPEKIKLVKQTKKLGLEKNVEFLGNINNWEKKNVFENTDIMVMPTIDESHNKSIEGFGISYIEAAFFGICSIATDVGGVREAIVNNETGILLKQNEDIYPNLKGLLLDKEKLNNLGKNAKKRAMTDFNWNKVFKNYLEVFDFNSY